MIEKIELDLKNPIFTAYINVDGTSRATAERHLIEARSMLDIYKNITFWILPSNETKIECVYSGGYQSHDKELVSLIKEINKRIDILSESKNFDDFKINFRNWRLENLIYDEEA